MKCVLSSSPSSYLSKEKNSINGAETLYSDDDVWAWRETAMMYRQSLDNQSV